MRGVLEPGCKHAQTTMNRSISCASVQASEPPTLSMPTYKVHVQRKRGTEAAVSWVWEKRSGWWHSNDWRMRSDIHLIVVPPALYVLGSK